ncbi:MAG: tetratricopeptide repeat protein [Chitinophagales bacterium]
MNKLINHIKSFIQKHKTLFIVLAVLKFLIKVGIILFLFTKAKSATAQTANQLLREGNKLYKQEKYNNATESYAKALQKAPKDVRVYFNQGDAFYRLNELDKSKEMFDAVAKSSKDMDIQARAFYNVGNIQYKQQKYSESAKSYKESLKRNPKDMDAKYNLMMALAKIKQNKNGGGGNDKNQDKNKNDKNQQQNKNQQNKNQNNQQQQQNNQQDKNQQQKNQPQQGQMSKEQAEQLLKAMSAEESKLQKELAKKKGKPENVKTQKDW